MDRKLTGKQTLTSHEYGSPSLDLKILDRRIEELITAPADRRRHSKKQIRQIAATIGTFGFNVPILIDRDDNVIAGHSRLLAVRELG